jgi:guanylate kinase
MGFRGLMFTVPGFPSDLRPIIITGTVGVGKKDVVRELVEQHPDIFARVVTHTTRRPRDAETDDESYHFVCAHEFEADVNSGKFLEHTVRNCNYFGTSRQAVEDIQAQGKIPILNLDVYGARKIKQDGDVDMRCVLIEAITWEATEVRVRESGRSELEVDKALSWIPGELEFAKEHAIMDGQIVNDVPQLACKRLERFIYTI